jgi:Zn-dependent peptidase ImmA (M78 family)
MMDEFSVVLKAREFMRAAGTSDIPPITAYLTHLGSRLHVEDDMEDGEDGSSFERNGRHHICVNGKQAPERRNFTICHEIAHRILGLPSEHGHGPGWSYARKSPNEIFCDVFAAEILLPYPQFKPLVEKSTIGFAAVNKLAKQFVASVPATASRLATVVSTPCAYVLIEGGIVRYMARSTALRSAGGWISPGTAAPTQSLAAKLRAGAPYEGEAEIAADIWFDNWARGGVLVEDAHHNAAWDQTLSLLWFDEEEVPVVYESHRAEEEDIGLRELDGNLPWPGRNRRR